MFGTFNSAAAKPNDYTFNGKQLVSNATAVGKEILTGGATASWLRSPSISAGYVPYVTATGTLSTYNYYGSYGMRAALWINLNS